jgi:metallo-beta-lactamase class B
MSAQKVKEPAATDPGWSKSYPPFRIAGNLYYVGTYDLASYLIFTTDGNILINTGLAASAAQIKNNIEALGFKFSDTKILLTTQAHYDHLGAMAAVKKMTGAKLMVDWQEAGVIQDGGSSDYALGGNDPSYEPMNPDRLLRDGDTVRLGNVHLIMLHHPGHTKGSCSFLLNTQDEKRSYKVLIANMPTIVTQKKFTEITSYPGIAKDYAFTLAAMKKLSFDIWVASHASQFDLHAKHKPGDAYNPAVFMDKAGYDQSLAELQREYEEHVRQ